MTTILIIAALYLILSFVYIRREWISCREVQVGDAIVIVILFGMCWPIIAAIEWPSWIWDRFTLPTPSSIMHIVIWRRKP